MRRYETFVIVDPDLPQDQREQVIQRVEELVKQIIGFAHAGVDIINILSEGFG